jgi:hypothetical protein
VHAVLAARRVRRRAQVHHGGLIGQRHEGVAEPLGQEYRPAVGVIEPHGLPPAEGGGARSHVHDHVQDRPGHAADVLRLPGRDIGVVDAPDHPAPRHRAVDLRDIELVAEVGGELGAAEELEEVASVVPMHLRGADPGALDAKRIHA